MPKTIFDAMVPLYNAVSYYFRLAVTVINEKNKEGSLEMLIGKPFQNKNAYRKRNCNLSCSKVAQVLSPSIKFEILEIINNYSSFIYIYIAILFAFHNYSIIIVIIIIL